MVWIGIETATGVTLAPSVRCARSFLQRFVGLLAHRRLAQDQGMLLMPGGSIHTLGMRFPIDAVFLDAQFQILRIAARLHPHRVATAPRGTRFVLEVAAGRADACSLQCGQQLVLRPGVTP